ncbi:hypothetical protein [Pseudotabrizicola algicola]|uniref:Uncharacterized protein n=1 Tax=Pseudotabrizicola algicola TaxID=2709381 RepID=A0A6B3RP19_9RHOB|nr:hypothetical protein [Pseudotabrizicola algicola]NEX44829.1 hypothetical protein [Pseudotabrizicola algicola]
MRPILLLLGFCLLGLSAYLSYGQLQGDTFAHLQPFAGEDRPAVAPEPAGFAPVAVETSAPATPRINLAPSRTPQGARFVKAPPSN